MEKVHLAGKGKTMGDTAVDGLIAGLPAGLAMGIFLALTGLLNGTALPTTLGYFDPAQGGNWLTGLLAHLAVSAIYGAVFGLLLKGVGGIRPSWGRLAWLWGGLFGLGMWGVARGVLLTAVSSPLAHIPAWQWGVAHLLYGFTLGYWLTKN